jgi:hypothetical protein
MMDFRGPRRLFGRILRLLRGNAWMETTIQIQGYHLARRNGLIDRSHNLLIHQDLTLLRVYLNGSFPPLLV